MTPPAQKHGAPMPEVLVVRRAGRSQSDEGIFVGGASKRTDDRRNQRKYRASIETIETIETGADAELRRLGLKP